MVRRCFNFTTSYNNSNNLSKNDEIDLNSSSLFNGGDITLITDLDTVKETSIYEVRADSDSPAQLGTYYNVEYYTMEGKRSFSSPPSVLGLFKEQKVIPTPIKKETLIEHRRKQHLIRQNAFFDQQYDKQINNFKVPNTEYTSSSFPITNNSLCPIDTIELQPLNVPLSPTQRGKPRVKKSLSCRTPTTECNSCCQKNVHNNTKRKNFNKSIFSIKSPSFNCTPQIVIYTSNSPTNTSKKKNHELYKLS